METPTPAIPWYKMTEKERNTAINERFMRIVPAVDNGSWTVGEVIYSQLPRYTANAELALEVIARIQDNGLIVRIDCTERGFVCCAYREDTKECVTSSVASTFPEAVCLCALESKGYRVLQCPVVYGGSDCNPDNPYIVAIKQERDDYRDVLEWVFEAENYARIDDVLRKYGGKRDPATASQDDKCPAGRDCDPQEGCTDTENARLRAIVEAAMRYRITHQREISRVNVGETLQAWAKFLKLIDAEINLGPHSKQETAH